MKVSILRVAISLVLLGILAACSNDEAGVKNTINSHPTNSEITGGVWAQLVLDISSAISGYSSQVSVVGGNDIEMGYSTATSARNWVDGYSAITNRKALYNFGNAPCPTSGTYVGTTNCSNGWTAEDVYYVSWGASASWPLPELYNTSNSNAYQWKSLSLYSKNYHNSAMSFIGVLTQLGACQQQGMPQSCNGVNNDPFSAWYQLYDALNYTNSTISQDPISYATDIRYYSTLYGY